MAVTKEPTLVIMAAGMGSRYGGLKQVDKITETGEIIIDFSLYDAMLAGFDRAIFIIREEHRDVFREIIDERAGRFMNIEYAYQKLDNIPEGKVVPEGRQKPWGTAHAVLSCEGMLDGPFAVINADDYYGPGAFATIYDYLTNNSDDDKYAYCMMGYKLENTVTENGTVSRGICTMDEKGFLQDVVERTKIGHHEDNICFTEDDGETWEVLPEGTLVSMNFWGFTASFMNELETGLEDFFETKVPENPIKAEYFLPTVADKLIKEGKARVKVLETSDKWYGVTYPEDKEDVKNALESMKDKGLYPSKLWK
ncbi:MAG: nucleotidyltransferase [Eubacterium sp.]|nr:nucleotidyltransferase [Candidatus Colimonas fimequi]